MKTTIIPVPIPSDLLITLNESEQELSAHFQVGVAMMLFREGKLTLGQATQVSGLTRYQFEEVLAKHHIPVLNLDINQALEDADKLA